MSLIQSILRFVSDTTGITSVKDAVGTILGMVDKDPELQEKLRRFEIEKMRELAKEGEGIRALWTEEIKSGDKFVRRARPWGLYLGYTLLLVDLGLLPLINAIVIMAGGEPIPYAILPGAFYQLFGMMFTGSLVYRAVEKRRKM